MSITAIMTGYNRPMNLITQVKAIDAQTVPPDDIFLWYNQGDAHQISVLSELKGLRVKHVKCDHNFKFHGRFALAMLAQTEYVAIFDDDSIPGPDWFKSCLETLETHEGILGASGVILKGPTYYPYFNAGWNATPGVSRDIPVEVDLVGHAWFIRKEYLKFMWMEEPLSWDNCEDLQLSFLAQKYGGIRTYCTPHPNDNQDIWGSIDGQRLGTDTVATSLQDQGEFADDRNGLVKEAINRGFRPLYSRLGQ